MSIASTIVKSLLSITKLQNLKAIHNLTVDTYYLLIVVINHKTTKFESNSQRLRWASLTTSGCYQSQNYKIWKQFTTVGNRKANIPGLLSITKLQNLKAIHNTLSNITNVGQVVINHKTTKFESNSQHIDGRYIGFTSCYQSQNYKIWKQFTTTVDTIVPSLRLLSITKLQNLKAIHNKKLHNYFP